MLRKLEKYEIHEEIGHGGMATVYRAHDTVLDRQVALKVMHPHLRGAEEARKRFHREARSVARLRHPKVLEIYDFSGEASAEAYIATELLTGPTLKHWREAQRNVPGEIAACIVIEICKALEAAHGASIIHRDVKPENVLLHENRTLKLTDFGIADMMDAASMTATGQILGSPGHMAPEQIEGGTTDARTDLFSLGTVLYYLATGRLPFTGRNPHQILKRIMDGEYADPLRINPTLGGPLTAIIHKSLSIEPDARYQSAKELREALEELVADSGIEDSEELLGRYLNDPVRVGEELNAQLVEILTERGRRASDDGDVPTALDSFNRVLAIDDGNERVLKLIERVGMDRRRRAAMFGGVALIATGLVAGLGAWAISGSGETDGDPVVPVIPLDERDAGPPDAGPPDAGAPDAREDVEPDAGPTGSDAGRTAHVVRPRATRVVRFVGQSARIGIDGAAPRPIDEVRTAQLTLGRHVLHIVPDGAAAQRDYRESDHNFVVRAGEGPQDVAVTLQFKYVRLTIRTVDTARVTILQGRQPRTRGEPNTPIAVEMHGRTEALRIRVEADGFQTRELPAQAFHVGESREIRVALQPDE